MVEIQIPLEKREKMPTNTNTQVSILTGVYALGLHSDRNPRYKSFAKKFISELELAISVNDGLATLTDLGEGRINLLWKVLLKDHLGLEDEGFTDMNDLAIAEFERGNARGSFIF
jgi:hypothetical protein